MARKQKLLSQSTGHLRVVEQEAKYKAEFLATDGLPELQKTPPAHLDKVAKAEYRRIINSLGTLPLRNLDRSELELYCTWYSIYKDASLGLNKENSKKRKSMVKVEAHIKTIDKATRNIKGLASDLGLTVNSRLQMNMPKNESENKPQSLREKYGIS
ncbi:phage terminase small subunit P27 family [Limosilactobacillus sp. RRLNB_1_1]|uniref:Phage terminase small subunit P27 family n=1 Tax=Limosilactobacillus albertensis TaxID=2759752 RepID=A0A7W3TR30_9LACO|nr:phage terminase small subunit P27 family [Limosilactobacillus albertensis]MBB1069198.1 phage terminase small subunit P27 family [Limosilactobacillus albertensis]MCD7118502.1 phage terminase small subunit P27 family [Limosilactobacillus albertensis]MCD7128645.1 phage terminase small subunit P27 family [Limosilactobacillus albertensis]